MLQLDSHKLMYHPRLVADFLDDAPMPPVNVEISPTGSCNHRCRFCNFEYLSHAPAQLPPDRFLGLVGELAGAGVRAVTFAGAGEPLLHPSLADAAVAARAAGLDAAVSTNGVLLNPGRIRELTRSLAWIRFSINGGTPESYAAVHRAPPGDLERAVANLSAMARAKRELAAGVTLGCQCVLVEENRHDIPALAAMVKEAGADYFVVKHFYPRLEGEYRPDMGFLDTAFLEDLERLARELSSDAFFMTIRDAGNLDRHRPYTQCLGLPFFAYVRENGMLYTCFSHQEDEKTAIGSLLEHDFATLWHSPDKDAAIRRINSHYDKNLCQANCRHHQMNLWLQRLRTPPEHVNFV